MLTDRQTLVGHRHDFEALGTYVIDSVTGLVAATVEPRANNFKDLAVKTSFAAPQQRKLAFRDEQSWRTRDPPARVRLEVHHLLLAVRRRRAQQARKVIRVGAVRLRTSKGAAVHTREPRAKHRNVACNHCTSARVPNKTRVGP